jgi:hypothetical protein
MPLPAPVTITTRPVNEVEVAWLVWVMESPFVKTVRVTNRHKASPWKQTGLNAGSSPKSSHLRYCASAKTPLISLLN